MRALSATESSTATASRIISACLLALIITTVAWPRVASRLHGRRLAVGGPWTRLTLSLRMRSVLRSERRQLHQAAELYLLQSELQVPVRALVRSTDAPGSDLLLLEDGTQLFLSPPGARGLEHLERLLKRGTYGTLPGTMHLLGATLLGPRLLLRFAIPGTRYATLVFPRHVSVLPAREPSSAA